LIIFKNELNINQYNVFCNNGIVYKFVTEHFPISRESKNNTYVVYYIFYLTHIY